MWHGDTCWQVMPAGRDKPVYAPYIEHVPPDVTACIFWLKNRDPEHWRDSQQLEHVLGKYINAELHALASSIIFPHWRPSRRAMAVAELVRSLSSMGQWTFIACATNNLGRSVGTPRGSLFSK
jgi:hypothetical protein